jgi:ABC-2 type transport system permease protein
MPRSLLPAPLETISDALPLSYAVDAMQELVRSSTTGGVRRDVAVVAVDALSLGAATLRRGNP